MSDMSKAPVISIDRNTLVPIGLLVAVVGSAIAAVMWLSSVLIAWQKEDAGRREVESKERQELALRLQRIEIELQGVRKSVTDTLNDHVSKGHLQEWIRLLAAQNPTLSVPRLER